MELIKMIAARADKLKEMKAFNEKHENMDDSQKAEFAALKGDYEKLSRDIDIAQNTEKLKNETDVILSPETARAIATSEYRAGFDNYIAGGSVGDFKAAMTVGVDAEGGYLVPESYQASVLSKLHTLSRTRSISTVYKTESTKNIPVEGEAPTFAWIDEGAKYGETDSDVGLKRVGAWKLGGIIKVSEEFLQDNMINFDEYMATQIAIGIDKAEAPAFCNGDGVKKPFGYATGLVATAKTTTAASDSVVEDEISSIFYALPEAYRNRATWRFNSDTAKKIRAIENAKGDKVFKEEIKMGTLETRPYIIDESMPNMGTGVKFAVLGDFTYYHIADRGDMSIQRLNEKYADDGMIGFKVSIRIDAKRMLDEAFVAAQNA